MSLPCVRACMLGLLGMHAKLVACMQFGEDGAMLLRRLMNRSMPSVCNRELRSTIGYQTWRAAIKPAKPAWRSS